MFYKKSAQTKKEIRKDLDYGTFSEEPEDYATKKRVPILILFFSKK